MLASQRRAAEKRAKRQQTTPPERHEPIVASRGPVRYVWRP
jgi:hypothetical protein